MTSTKMKTTKSSSPEASQELLRTLQARFEKNMNRHKGLEWVRVQAKLEADTKKLWALGEMESTGGEPDVVGFDKKTGEYIFYDCSAESPNGRRSVCYDRKALEARKEHKPKNSAIDLAAAIGVEILSEEQYYELQKLGEFDLKTSSCVQNTADIRKLKNVVVFDQKPAGGVQPPADIRKLGGAISCDRRFGRVFTGHNGADSYYAARGFLGSTRV